MELAIGRELSTTEIKYYRSLTPAQKIQLTYELSKTLISSTISKESKTDDSTTKHVENKGDTKRK